MLVLTRSIGERLIIGDGEICLHVLEVRGNQVRLGVDAPRHISVHREEVFQRIAAKAQPQSSAKVEENQKQLVTTEEEG